MIIVNYIMIDSTNNIIGAELNLDGNVQKYNLNDLKKLLMSLEMNNIKLENAIIDKNGIIKGKKGFPIPRVKINTNPDMIENKDMYEAKKLIKNKNIILYHGNKDKYMVPTFGYGEVDNDYGQGFYTTPNKELAKEWAWGSYTSGDKAYLHTFSMNVEGLNILNFTQLHSENWVAELLYNRTINLESEIYVDVMKKFVRTYKINTSNYDVIIGYRADDSYFKYAVDFIKGAIYKSTIETALRNGQLGIQVFIRSKKAFDRLKRIEIEDVPYKYRDKYIKRDKAAREKYNQDKINQKSSMIKVTVRDLL